MRAAWCGEDKVTRGHTTTLFAQHGIPVILNAAGTLTRLSGAPLAPGVADAMAAADSASVDLFTLHAHASRVIAGATGAEAGLVTNGAAGGLLLAAAACMAGLDVGLMNSLPEGAAANEFIVARGQRNGYDHALRAAGARLVEVGLPEPLAGAGVRHAEPWEYAQAITERTAAIFYVASSGAEPSLAEIVSIARSRDLPVIVDAAAELPPQDNLRRFIAEGADLVVFSGGKALGGPAGSGILCGRGALVMSAALQCLDVDVHWRDWSPPADFVDKGRFDGVPRQGVGRACKTGKHEVMGLLAALDHFLSEDDATRHARWLAVCERIADNLKPRPGAATRIRGKDDPACVPRLEIAFETAEQAQREAERLLSREVPVHVARDHAAPQCLLVNPTCLREAEIPLLIAALGA